MIVDPKLKAKLQKAALEFGVETVEDLAVALADAGYLQVKGALDVQPIPREAVGAAILERLQEPEPESFAQLLPAQKQAVILYLLSQDNTPHYVSCRFWIPIEEVMRVWQRYSELIGQDVCQIRFESFVGQLHMRVERIYSQAMKAEKLDVASNVMFRYTKALQDLGILYRKPIEIELKTADENKVIEDEALRIVELKKKMQKEITDGGTSEAPPAPPAA